MIWATTLAILLGTLAAVLLTFVFLFKREQIREILREQRKERRTPVIVDLEVCSSSELPSEIAVTENVSRHGARIVTKNCWRRNDPVLVRLPGAYTLTPAKIAYCNTLPQRDVFATGLRFSSAVDLPDFRPPSPLDRSYRK